MGRSRCGASAPGTASTTRRSCSPTGRCRPSAGRTLRPSFAGRARVLPGPGREGSTSFRNGREPRKSPRLARCSSQASQILRRSGVCRRGLFQSRSHVAGAWQPLAEQRAGPAGVRRHGVRLLIGWDMDVVPESHGGSRPAPREPEGGDLPRGSHPAGEITPGSYPSSGGRVEVPSSGWYAVSARSKRVGAHRHGVGHHDGDVRQDQRARRSGSATASRCRRARPRWPPRSTASAGSSRGCSASGGPRCPRCDHSGRW